MNRRAISFSVRFGEKSEVEHSARRGGAGPSIRGDRGYIHQVLVNVLIPRDRSLP